MAYTIISQPAALSLSGNMPDIVLSANASVYFKLKRGTEVILDEVYTPDADAKITIPLKNLVDTLLYCDIPTSDLFEQAHLVQDFVVELDSTTTTYRVVKGGVDAVSVDADAFLKQNWLTWQPQSKAVKYSDPEYLTYYATEAITVKAKGYKADGTSQIINLATLAAGKAYSINVQYGHLLGLFTNSPSYIDVWAESATSVRLSFIQRYILTNDFYEFDDLFLFANSLGGLDTIRMTGPLSENNESASSSALFDEDTIEYDIDINRSWSKNTGHFHSYRQQEWATEFIHSIKRYHVSNGTIKQIVVRKSDIKITKGDLNAYSFTFAYTKQTKRLNLPRTETLPEVIEMVDPAGTLFFLAPRLSEFKQHTPDDSSIFAIQSPFSAEWHKMSLFDLLTYFSTKFGLTPGSEGGLPLATYSTTGAVKVDLYTLTVDAAGLIGVNGDLSNLSNYYTKTVSDERYLLKTEAPDLTPYATKTELSEAIATHAHSTYVKYQSAESNAPQTIYGDIIVKGKIYSSDDIVAFSDGTGGGTAPGIPLATYATVGVVKVDPTTMTVDENGMIAVKGDLFNLSNYYDKSASDGRFAALGHVHAFSEITGKPTTIAGYGITDAMTTSQISTAIAQAKADIVNSSPAALDTLNELAAALGNDPNFATTTATALGNRLRVDISTQGLTDAQRANGRANLGLGSAATKEISEFRWYDGWVNNPGYDANTIGEFKSGFSYSKNAPNNGCLVHFGAEGYGLQISSEFGYNGYKISYRTRNGDNGTWNSWYDMYHTGNLNRSDADFVAKNIITNGFITIDKASDDIIMLKSNGGLRYDLYYSGGNEGSGNTGKNLTLYCYDNNGGYLGPSFTINRGDRSFNFYTNAQSYTYSGAGFTATGWGITADGDANLRDLLVRTNLSVATQTIRAADGSVKWTIQLNASNALDFYNASGVLEMRLSQAGKLQTRDDIEAFSNFN